MSVLRPPTTISIVFVKTFPRRVGIGAPHQCSLGGGSLLPSIHADVRAILLPSLFQRVDDVVLDGNGNADFSLDPWGGQQEARGHSSGGPWYVENVAEELDVPREWFLDTAVTPRKLYVKNLGNPS